VDAPEGFERILGALPKDVVLERGLRGRPDIVLWFVRSQKELRRALPKWVRAAGTGARIWVAWPKKTSPLAGDLTQDLVRATPHAHGLVDYKICALDADWSGMCFAKRRSE
jgi:hypothetical protein